MAIFFETHQSSMYKATIYFPQTTAKLRFGSCLPVEQILNTSSGTDVQLQYRVEKTFDFDGRKGGRE